MNPWLETAGIILATFAGVLAGGCFSRLRRWHWAIGYAVGFGLLGILLLPRLDNSLAFQQPFFWLTAGRVKFVVLCLAVTIGLTTPISRLPHKAEKVLTMILMFIVVSWFCVLPFLFPALLEKKLSRMNSIFDTDGICYQSTDYTCGPAAAVTALKRLGFQATEAQIAIMSRSNPVTGTLPGSLLDTLDSLYSNEGLKCKYRSFESPEQLKDEGITLAMIRDTFFNDHCVAVIEVTDDKVTLADPVVGKMRISYEHFNLIWRHCGIVLTRQNHKNI